MSYDIEELGSIHQIAAAMAESWAIGNRSDVTKTILALNTWGEESTQVGLAILIARISPDFGEAVIERAVEDWDRDTDPLNWDGYEEEQP